MEGVGISMSAESFPVPVAECPAAASNVPESVICNAGPHHCFVGILHLTRRFGGFHFIPGQEWQMNKRMPPPPPVSHISPSSGRWIVWPPLGSVGLGWPTGSQHNGARSATVWRGPPPAPPPPGPALSAGAPQRCVPSPGSLPRTLPTHPGCPCPCHGRGLRVAPTQPSPAEPHVDAAEISRRGRGGPREGFFFALFQSRSQDAPRLPCLPVFVAPESFPV